MISVCIPVYNYDISELVGSLLKQQEVLTNQVEIVVLDDGSDPTFKTANRQTCEGLNYTELPENKGRAAIRNHFLDHAKHPWLLFLDCDSLVKNPEFLTRYIATIKEDKAKVICGGRVYPSSCPDPSSSLRFRYGVERESQPVNVRLKNPYKSFMTNNFVVHREILKRLPFNEKIRNYGHEDTLFGIQLEQHNIAIDHKDNPVLNGHLETNEEFLIQTQQAIENLVMLLENPEYKSSLIDAVSLLKTYYKNPLTKLVARVGYKLNKGRLEKKAQAGSLGIPWFSMYKLGYLDQLLKN